MSTVIMSACWPLKMPPSPKAVLISLADNANDDGVCWPSILKICERTCLSRRCVQDAIQWLVASGAVRVTRQELSSNVYRICPDEFDADFHVQSVRSQQRKVGSVGGADAVPPSANAAPPPVQMPRPPRANAAPRTVIEPSIEPSLNRNGSGESGDAVLAACRETWSAYVSAYRRRYSVDPVRNAKTNTLIRRIVDRLGQGESPQVIAFFVAHPGAYYAQRGHALDCALADAEKLRTEWMRGSVVTAISARAGERTASNPFAGFAKAAREREARNA